MAEQDVQSAEVPIKRPVRAAIVAFLIMSALVSTCLLPFMDLRMPYLSALPLAVGCCAVLAFAGVGWGLFATRESTWIVIAAAILMVLLAGGLWLILQFVLEQVSLEALGTILHVWFVCVCVATAALLAVSVYGWVRHARGRNARADDVPASPRSEERG